MNFIFTFVSVVFGSVCFFPDCFSSGILPAHFSSKFQCHSYWMNRHFRVFIRRTDRRNEVRVRRGWAFVCVLIFKYRRVSEHKHIEHIFKWNNSISSLLLQYFPHLSNTHSHLLKLLEKFLVFRFEIVWLPMFCIIVTLKMNFIPFWISIQYNTIRYDTVWAQFTVEILKFLHILPIKNI